jgi:hypothetical protein
VSDCCNPCEEFEEGEIAGQCTPRRLKTSCEGPVPYSNPTAVTVTLPCPDGTVGEEVSVTVEVGEVANPFSAAAAQAAAQAQAEEDAAALRAAIPCLYPNEPQTCEDVCPEGTEGETISVTIGAGEFLMSTLEAANAAALAEACAQVADQRSGDPCIIPVVEFSMAFRIKEGTDPCGPEEFGTFGQPVVYAQTGAATNGCMSAGDVAAIASAVCGPTGINVGPNTVTYELLDWSIDRAVFTIGCGASYDVAVAAFPASGGGGMSVGAGVGSIALSRLPIDNPYRFVLTVKFDLVGSYVEAPDSEQFIDVSEVVVTSCLSTVEDVVIDEGIPWEASTQEEAISFVTPNEAGTEVSYRVAQVRGEATGLVVGQLYHMTLTYSSRTTGTLEPFEPLTTIEVWFTAAAETHTTDWYDVPIAENTDTSTDGVIDTVPLLSVAIGADGETWTFTFDRVITAGAGGTGGWAPQMDIGAGTALTYASGIGTTELVYTGSKILGSEDTGTINFTNPGNGLEGPDGDDVPTFTGFPITNNSTVLAEPDLQWTTFDEGAGLSFASRIGSGGIISDAAMWVSGEGGFSLQGEFSTNKNANTSFPVGFDSAEVITMFLRFNAPFLVSTQMWAETGEGTVGGMGMYQTGGTAVAYVFGPGKGYIQSELVTPPSTGAWHSLMAVMNRTDRTIELWLDGVSAPSTLAAGSGMSTRTIFEDLTLNICNRGSGVDLSTDTKIDDIRIWTGDQSAYAAAVHADVI